MAWVTRPAAKRRWTRMKKATGCLSRWKHSQCSQRQSNLGAVMEAQSGSLKAEVRLGQCERCHGSGREECVASTPQGCLWRSLGSEKHSHMCARCQGSGKAAS